MRTLRACTFGYVLLGVLLIQSNAHAFELAWSMPSTPSHSVGSSSEAMVGVEFTPNQDITITALGLYDDTFSSPAGFHNAHPVGIWNKNTFQLLAWVTVPAGTSGQLINRFRFEDLDQPLNVTAGTEYIIAALGNDTDDPGTLVTPGNNLIVDPAITLGKWRIGNPSFGYPGTVIDAATREMGPSFLWTPEPASVCILGAGALVVFRRRRLNRSA